jgi:hypothetical protein
MGVTEQTGQPWVKPGHDGVEADAVYLTLL